MDININSSRKAKMAVVISVKQTMNEVENYLNLIHKSISDKGDAFNYEIEKNLDLILSETLSIAENYAVDKKLIFGIGDDVDLLNAGLLALVSGATLRRLDRLVALYQELLDVWTAPLDGVVCAIH